jgi:heptosyltransferase-2
LIRATGTEWSVGLDNGRGSFLTDAVPDAGFGDLHETDYMLAVARKAGGSDVECSPTIISENDEIQSQLPNYFVAMYPVTGSYSSARNWELARFIQLGELIVKQGYSIVVIGGSDSQDSAARIQQQIPDAFNFAGKTSISELATILRNARMAVGADTFAGHLAAAVRTPVVSIFGPSNHRAWRPYCSEIFGMSPAGESRGVVITADLPCSPCLYTGYQLGRPDGCPDRTCLKNISVEQVFAALMTFGNNYR